MDGKHTVDKALHTDSSSREVMWANNSQSRKENGPTFSNEEEII